jgi:diguanylate cyclase (GGDEF)-like protein
MLAEREQALDEQRRLNAELEAARAEADRRAREDALTGVANRRHGSERLAGELERTRRSRERLGVLLLDVDDFKLVNDVHGHAAGDAVLAEVATRLGAAVRLNDCVARWGGEEFLVLLPGVADEAALLAVAEAKRESIGAAPVVTSAGRRIAVTVSVGAALTGPDEACTPEALVDAADQALYRAKRLGRNRAELGALGGQAGHAA